MFREEQEWWFLPGGEPGPAYLEDTGHPTDCARGGDLAAVSACEDIWDVFRLDDEAAEPEPEPGDFWGHPYDEEPI